MSTFKMRCLLLFTLLCTVASTAVARKVLQVPFNRTALHHRYTRRAPCHGRVGTEHSLVANQRTIDYYPGFSITTAGDEEQCMPYISLHFTRRTSHPFIRKHTYERTTGEGCASTKKTEEYWPWGKSRDLFMRHLRIMTTGAIALRDSSCPTTANTETSPKSTTTPTVVPSTSISPSASRTPEVSASASSSPPNDDSVVEEAPILGPLVIEPEAELSALPIPTISSSPCAKYEAELHTVQRGKVTSPYELDEPPHHLEPLPIEPKNPVLDFKGAPDLDDDYADYFADAPERDDDKDMFKTTFEGDEKDMYKDAYTSVPGDYTDGISKDDQATYKSINHIIGYLMSLGFDYYFESVTYDKEILKLI